MTNNYQQNDEDKKKKRRVIPIIIIIILLLIIGGLVVFFVVSQNSNSGVQGEYIGDNAQGMDFESGSDASGNKIIKSIAMPGWETMHLTAGSTVQEDVDIYNPEENAGKFLLTFELKLADGETLYKSGLVKGGVHLRTIELNRALPAGQYEAVLHIQPYTDDEKKSAKNTADVELTLIVQ